jgi:hypothetical protein
MPRLFKKKRKRDGPENTRKLKQFPPRDKTLNVSQRRLKGQAFRQRTRGTRIEEYRAVGVQKDGVESKSTDQYEYSILPSVRPATEAALQIVPICVDMGRCVLMVSNIHLFVIWLKWLMT